MDNLQQFKDKKIYATCDSDLDGVSSRIILEWYLKPIAKNFFIYNTADRALPEFEFNLAKNCDIVIFCDIAPPDLDFYNKIKEHSEVFIFDHHQSHRDILGDLDNYIFDLEKCGARIVYDYLTEGKRKKPIINQYIELADTYDRYVTDSKLWDKAKGLHNSMYGYVNWKALNYETDTERYEKFINTQFKKFREFNNFFFTQYESAQIQKALQKEETSYKSAKKNLKFRKDTEGNNYAYTECSAKLSLVAHRLLQEIGEKISYLAMFSTWKKDNLQISLRSKGEFDTKYVSEKWGGGGHKNASGFEFKTPEDLKNFKEGKIHLI